MRYHYEGPWPFPPPQSEAPQPFLRRRWKALVAGSVILAALLAGAVWVVSADPGHLPNALASTDTLDGTGGGGGEALAGEALATDAVPSGGTSSLRVTSIPEGASVMLDYVYIGTTPLWLSDLKSGTYTLSVSDEGALPLDTLVTLRPNQTAMLTLSPKARRSSAPSLSAPSFSAPISSEATRDVPPPPIALSPSLPNAVPPSRTPAPPTSSTSPAPTRPPPANQPVATPRSAPPARSAPPPAPPAAAGTLAIVVRPWGTIAVDGTIRARETDVQYQTQVAPGRHLVRAVHPVLGSREVEVTVQPGRTAHLEIDLNDD